MRSAQYLQLNHDNPLVAPVIITVANKAPLNFWGATVRLGVDPVFGSQYLHIDYDLDEVVFEVVSGTELTTSRRITATVLDDRPVADLVALLESDSVSRARVKYCASLGVHSRAEFKGPRYTQTVFLLSPPRRKPISEEPPWTKPRPWVACLAFRNSHSPS